MAENSDVGGREQSGGPVVVVVSPHAEQLDIAGALAAAGVTVGEQVRVGDLDDDRPLGAQWRAQGYRAVVAAGGDGTAGTVATQLIGSKLSLGILPLGTSNDTARALALPLDLDAASAVVARGVPTPITVGQVTPLPPGGELSLAHAAPGRGNVFLHALTLGLNVAFAHLATDVAERQRWGKLTYPVAALEALSQFEPVSLTLQVLQSDGASPATAPERVSCKALQLALVNLPVFGGALRLRLPGAAVGDGLLNLVLIEAPEPLELGKLVEGLLAAASQLAERVGNAAPQPEGRAATNTDEAASALPGVRRYTVTAVLIETPTPVELTLDGEVRGRTPALVSVASEPLPVLVPPEARPLAGAGRLA